VDTILITGANGFVGRNLVDFLLRETEDKIVSLHRSPQPFRSNDRIKNIYYDLRDPIDQKTIKEIGNIDYIVHLAGSTCAKKSFIDPADTITNNMIGTANLLEYICQNLTNLKQLLYFSTAEIFGPTINGTSFKESDPTNANSPYAATKIGAQELCVAYQRTYEIPVVFSYAMNSFGPYQSSEKFIPILIKKISEGEKVSIHLDGNSKTPLKRNYLHIKDMCDVILFLLHRGMPGQKYNIVAEEQTDNLMLAQIISKLLDKRLNYELTIQDQNTLAHPYLNGEKLQKLGWRQKIRLEKGLEELIEWTKKEKYDN
jgi:dTDP-D-glucose 4,6-dehydratase